MPRQPRMDPDERLTQIVDTASELLSLKGYFGFSVGELAQRCGLSNAGLIHHIGTKQRVLHMVLDARDARDLAVMAEAAGGVDWEAVEAGCAALDTRTVVAMLHALVEHNEAYRPKRVGFGLVGFVPGSAVVEVGPVNCGSPPVDLGLCLGAVAGLVELVNDLLVGDRGFKDVCWGGRELGVQVAPPQHGLDLVIKTHATSTQRSWVEFRSGLASGGKK